MVGISGIQVNICQATNMIRRNKHYTIFLKAKSQSKCSNLDNLPYSKWCRRCCRSKLTPFWYTFFISNFPYFIAHSITLYCVTSFFIHPFIQGESCKLSPQFCSSLPTGMCRCRLHKRRQEYHVKILKYHRIWSTYVV